MSAIFKIIVKLLLAAWIADKSVKENSIVGESRFDRETRRILGICTLIFIVGLAAVWAWQEWG